MQFMVNGIPTKRRVRFTRGGRTYVDAKTKAEMALIASKYTGQKIRGCVSVEVDIYPKLPKNTPKRIAELPADKKPDCDNVLKIVMDALQGVAYDDDKQVTHTRVDKHAMQRIEWDYIVVTVNPVRG